MLNPTSWIPAEGRQVIKDSVEEEQILNAAIIDGTGMAGNRAAVCFDDPDAVIAVETIGSNAGMPLGFREDLQRCPFLHID